MDARVFTDKWLRSLTRKPPSERRDYTEAGRRGLMVRHHPGGTVAFVVRYQLKGQTQLITLGAYPAMSLEQAHDEHAVIRKQLTRGLDPTVEREAAARARERRREREQAADVVAVRNVIAEWGWHYARRERKHPREAVRLLKVYVAGPWKGRPVRDLTRRDAVLLLDRITARGSLVMANRIRNLASQAFAFAIERDLIETNPFAGTRKPGGRETPKERSLTAEEIRSVWSGLESRDFKATRGVRLAMKLVLVSAQRPGEVAGMRWDEIDLDAKVWTIPAARSKNGREHHVPLTDLALELLGQARAFAPDRPHVFPSAHAHRKADAPMLALALSRALRNNRKGERVLGVECFTPHDLRRSAASTMTSLGIPRLHVAKLLNHADREVTSIYDRHDYAAEKRAALQMWADHLRGLVAGNKPKVLPIRPEAGVAS